MPSGESNNKGASPIKAGLRCKCPYCHKGRLFKSYLKVASHCNHCGADLSQEDSGDGPAPFIMLIVGFIVMGLALFVELKYSPPYWLHMVLWLPLSSLLIYMLLQPLKEVMINLQFHHSARGTTHKDVINKEENISDDDT